MSYKEGANLNIWRVGAGDKHKDLVPTMIKKGVMMIGPGEIKSIGDMKNEGEIEKRLKDKNLPYKSDRARKNDAKTLFKFCNEAEKDELVVLRLGSVCFSVGVISGPYKWDEQFSKEYSYWNPQGKYNNCLKNLTKDEKDAWDLQHTREVRWFILKDEKALCFFRRGIYGGAQRFCKVGDIDLKTYLKKQGYDNKNGGEILSKIGSPTNCVNEYGFPTPK